MVVLLGWMKWFAWRRDSRFRRPFDEMERPAGWSLQRRMQDAMDDAMTSLLSAFMVGGLAWALSLSAKLPGTALVICGFLATSGCVLRSGVGIKRYINCRLGLQGEQIVGQVLDRASSETIEVFHDLEIREPGKKPWNIDHVVLTPAGVFAIETKARRKPRTTAGVGQQGHKVLYDGRQLLFPSPMKANRFGLEQAERNSVWLGEKIRKLTGERIPVWPVLVLPGWWVEAKGKGPVSVLNQKQLPGYLSKRPSAIHPKDLHVIRNFLGERCAIDLSSGV